MRHAADQSHIDVADLSREILGFVQSCSDQSLATLGLTEDAIREIKGMHQVQIGRLSGAGCLALRPVLIPRVDDTTALEQLSPISGEIYTNSAQSTAEIGQFRELMVRWCASLRETASRSLAEAVIRFRLSGAEVKTMCQMTWPEVHAVIRGGAALKIQLVFDQRAIAY